MTLWVVAGCLFEVSFPDGEGWRWAAEEGPVTLLAEQVRDDRRHFRFRAEGPGAGAVLLAFERGHDVCRVPVHIAPERPPD